MKILIDLTGLYDRKHTGVENYSKELFSELCDQKLDVIGIFSKENQLSKDQKHAISFFKNRVINDFFVIPFFILKYRPKVVIFPIFPPLVLIYLFRLLGVKIVPVVHDLAFKRYSYTLSLLAKIYLSYRYFAALKFSSSIITVSEHVKLDIMQFTRCKIYNFGQHIESISLPNSKEIIYTVLDRYSVVAGEYILSVSTVEPRKNLKYLLRIMICFNQMGLNTKLLLVGRMGWNSDKELNGLLNELGDKVLFTGYVTNEEVSVLYSNCNYFMLMSLYEGFGRTPLEAALLGAQVVVSDIPAFRENLDGLATFLSLDDIEVAIDVLKNRTHHEINTATLLEVVNDKWKVDVELLV